MEGWERLAREVRRGLLAAMVLSMLARWGPMHGYGLRARLRAEAGLDAPETTLYDVLKRLERLGLVRGYWARASGGVIRRYYRILPGACRALREVEALLGKALEVVVEGAGSCG